MAWQLACEPASDAIAVAPCGTVEGVGFSPVMVQTGIPGLDFAGAGELFAYSFSIVMVCFVTGVGIGAIIRVIRST